MVMICGSAAGMTVSGKLAAAERVVCSVKGTLVGLLSDIRRSSCSSDVVAVAGCGLGRLEEREPVGSSSIGISTPEIESSITMTSSSWDVPERPETGRRRRVRGTRRGRSSSWIRPRTPSRAVANCSTPDSILPRRVTTRPDSSGRCARRATCCSILARRPSNAVTQL